MEPATLAIVHWLASNVGLPILNAGIDQLLIQMGIKDPSSPSKEHVLIEKYIRQLEKDIRQVKATLDEDRLAKLRAALVQVSESQKTVARREYLTNALNNFHVVVNYPEHGLTGNYTNTQLRCIAFVGMAAAHTALHDSQSLVAEKVVEAVSADADTAKEWLGEKLVNQILSLLPPPEVACPKCGFQNPAGSQFCNRDGFPLKLGQKPSLHISSQPSSFQLIRLRSFWNFIYSYEILLDGIPVGDIGNGGTWRTELEPGHHILTLRFKPLEPEDYMLTVRFRLSSSNAGSTLRHTDSTPKSTYEIVSLPFNFVVVSGEEIILYCQTKLSVHKSERARMQIWR